MATRAARVAILAKDLGPIGFGPAEVEVVSFGPE
jgi:hypothetical protein